MDEILTEQDKIFVKELTKTGNKTQSARKAYKYKNDNTAGVMALDKLRKPKIQKVIKTFADRVPDDKLFKVLDEGLEAGKRIFKNNNESGEIEDLGVEPDFPTRHKYLETGLKIKNYFPKEGNTTAIQVNINKFKEYE